MFAATTYDLMENTRRDENDVLRVPIVSLTLVLPGAVDCSLAVTNNSPVCLVILLRFFLFVSRLTLARYRLPSAEQFFTVCAEILIT